MAKGGKAYGSNLAYQKLCRDIIQKSKLKDNLVPYKGNGIDVPLRIGGTEVTFDVVFKNSQGKLVVIECKRWKNPIKQNELFAFAGLVECLRKELGVSVAGIFVTKTGYQIGAIKYATNMGIDVAVCDQNQSVKHFAIIYKHYDLQRVKIIQNARVQLSGDIKPIGNLFAKVIRKDGSVEDLGELK